MNKTLTVKVLLNLGYEWTHYFPADLPREGEIRSVPEAIGHRMLAAGVAALHEAVVSDQSSVASEEPPQRSDEPREVARPTRSKRLRDLVTPTPDSDIPSV
jgi:hypothetical protein